MTICTQSWFKLEAVIVSGLNSLVDGGCKRTRLNSALLELNWIIFILVNEFSDK